MMGEEEAWPFISTVDLAFQAIIGYLGFIKFKIAENGHVSSFYKDLFNLRKLNCNAFEALV